MGLNAKQGIQMHRGNDLIMTKNYLIMTIDEIDTASKMAKVAILLKRLEKSLYCGNWLLPVVYNFSFQKSNQLKLILNNSELNFS